MLDIISQGHRLIKEDYLVNAQPINNFKDWLLEFEPSVINQNNPLNNQAGQNVQFTIKGCIYINFKGFNHQLDKFPTQNIDLMDWGEYPNSELLRSYLNDPQSHPYKPNDTNNQVSQFHHLFFESFSVDIDILCQDLLIEVKTK